MLNYTIIIIVHSTKAFFTNNVYLTNNAFFCEDLQTIIERYLKLSFKRRESNA